MVRCKRLRIHVAARELKIKENGFACRKTTVAKKYQTIELKEKYFRARRFRFYSQWRSSSGISRKVKIRRRDYGNFRDK